MPHVEGATQREYEITPPSSPQDPSDRHTKNTAQGYTYEELVKTQRSGKVDTTLSNGLEPLKENGIHRKLTENHSQKTDKEQPKTKLEQEPPVKAGDDASGAVTHYEKVLPSERQSNALPLHHFSPTQQFFNRTGVPASDHRKDNERRLSKKLSGEKLRELINSPESLPTKFLSPPISEEGDLEESSVHTSPTTPGSLDKTLQEELTHTTLQHASRKTSFPERGDHRRPRNLTIETNHHTDSLSINTDGSRPRVPRALSTPVSMKSPPIIAAAEGRKVRTSSRAADQLRSNQQSREPSQTGNAPSPMPISIPLPPLSLPTYLQLEMSSHRPSQLYIHRSANLDFPYESSKVKIERLLNFLFLPHQLEGVLWFGTLACLDSWLYTFTILPLRLLKSIYILSQSLVTNLINEAKYISTFIFAGSQRMWHRRRTRTVSTPQVLSRTSSETQIQQSHAQEKQLPNTTAVSTPLMSGSLQSAQQSRNRTRSGRYNHRRTKSVPSNLLPDDKADILKSLLIICTTLLLLKLDASRMYHWVRGQAAIKLYVIYNLLEVCDRLLSAIGQDVLECLFSQETLERKPDGHSKLLRPFWLFLLSLVYCTTHATALFYQVVTLNVAVNSYSNALITLLLSNQFVEIKSTVFKKFEKENLFQLTCADIVERFQLWHMLMIIASRNIVETGGLSFGLNALGSTLKSPAATATSPLNANITHAAPPLTASSILPRSFMIVPSMFSSITSYVPTISHVLGPFVIVLGSEMFIDWLKHAYINKFNNTKPIIYGRFLDILAKDYYTNAFGNQNLTKRLGLPVIPLSCLMIRAGFQTYQMFVASWMPSSLPISSTTSLTSIHEVSSYPYSATGERPLPTSTVGIIVRRMDDLFSQLPTTISNSTLMSYFTTILVLLLMFLVLLICKLTLGMGLLAFSRARYRAMKEQERLSQVQSNASSSVHTGSQSYHVDGGRRVGGWGVVEVDEDKRRWIYDDDPAGVKGLRDRETKEKAKKEAERERGYTAEALGIDRVKRYEMVAKRIW